MNWIQQAKATGQFEGEFAEQDPTGKFGTSQLQCEMVTGYWYSNDKPKNRLLFYLALESESVGTPNHQYAVAGATDDELINHNAKLFIDSIQHGNKHVVASLVAYPIKVTINKKTRQINNANELVKNYDVIFFDSFVEAISNAIPHNMFARDQGIMLGNGEVWFGSNGKVIALNN